MTPGTRRPALRDRVAAGERLLGTLVRLPAEQLVEMAGLAGLDFLVVDCEHGPADLVPLQHHLAMAEAGGLDVLVRVGGVHPQTILRVLDLGAAGVVVPRVSSAEEAEAVVRAAHYPPVGRRGFATYTRAGGYGRVSAADHLAAAAATYVVVMVESEAAVAAVDDICAVPGVDAVLVGPADLAVDLLARGVADVDTVVATATAHAQGTARRSGRHVMAIVGDADAASAAFAAGAGLVVYNTQLALRDLFTRLASARR